jgi:hypothetical protein
LVTQEPSAPEALGDIDAEIVMNFTNFQVNATETQFQQRSAVEAPPPKNETNVPNKPETFFEQILEAQKRNDPDAEEKLANEYI